MFTKQCLERKAGQELRSSAIYTRYKPPIYLRKNTLKSSVAFPGGTGTLEEIAEVMSKVSLKHLDAPCILYDLDGYYTGLRMLLGHMIETGLSSEERQKGIYFAKDLAEIKTILNR